MTGTPEIVEQLREEEKRGKLASKINELQQKNSNLTKKKTTTIIDDDDDLFFDLGRIL